MQDGFGVGPGPVPVTRGLELRFEFGMVINLTVKDNPCVLIAGRHRLRAARDIHDRQAAMCETDGTFRPDPFSVRPAVTQHVSHPAQTFDVDRLIGVEVDDSGNAAHMRQDCCWITSSSSWSSMKTLSDRS